MSGVLTLLPQLICLKLKKKLNWSQEHLSSILKYLELIKSLVVTVIKDEVLFFFYEPDMWLAILTS